MSNFSQIQQAALEPPLTEDLSGQTKEVKCFAEISGGTIEYHEFEPSGYGWCWQVVVSEIELTLVSDEDGNWWPDVDDGLIVRSCKLWEGVSGVWHDYLTLFGEKNHSLIKSLLWQDVCTQQGETFIFD